MATVTEGLAEGYLNEMFGDRWPIVIMIAEGLHNGSITMEQITAAADGIEYADVIDHIKDHVTGNQFDAGAAAAEHIVAEWKTAEKLSDRAKAKTRSEANKLARGEVDLSGMKGMLANLIDNGGKNPQGQDGVDNMLKGMEDFAGATTRGMVGPSTLALGVFFGPDNVPDQLWTAVGSISGMA